MSARRLLAGITVLAVAAGLAGCVGRTPEPAPTPQAVDAVNEKPDPAPADVPAGQDTALARYVESVQSQIPLIIGDDDTYSEMRILAVPPGTIEYAYHYAEHLDPAVLATMFDELIPVLQAGANLVILEMTAYGVTADAMVRYTYYDAMVRYTYYNADGSLIWSHTFERS